MKYFLTALFFSHIIFHFASIGQVIPEIVIPNAGTAVTDNALCLRTNPAGLAVKRSPELFLLNYSSNGEYQRNGAFYFRLLGLGVGAEFVDEASVRYNRYMIGTGFDLGYGLKVGAGYNWYRHLDLGGGWDFGLLFRPSNYLSLGITAKNINSPRINNLNNSAPSGGYLTSSLIPVDGKIRPRYNIGLGFKPLIEQLTCSIELSLFRDMDNLYGDSLDLTYRADYEPFAGLNISLAYKPDAGYFGGGLSFSLPHAGFITESNFDGDGKGRGTSHVCHLTFDRMRSFTVPGNCHYLIAELDGRIAEEPENWSPFVANDPTLHQVVKAINHIRDDDNIRGLIIRLGFLDCGLATVQELRQALLNFQEEGKDLIVFAESIGNKEYYLASAAPVIVMAPSGYLGLTGLSIETTFIKGLLDNIGINAELEHAGEYKSSSDIMTREGMSQAHRTAEIELLESLFDDFAANISYDRGIEYDTLISIIDRGPFTAQNAYKEGIIDSIMYQDEVEDMVDSFFNGKAKVIKASDYWRFGEYSYSWGEPFLKKIAVIYAAGTIASGSSGYGLFSGKIMGSETVARYIRDAREDWLVKAIVLRINSPGGDGIASDEIWREVKRTVTGDSRKPLIVSMGDLAASGGYYIACMADTIVADPGTITGSIGVISGKYDLSGLQEKIGLKTEIVKRGKHADYFTSSRAWTEEEREHQRKLVQDFYSEFIDRVSQGRDMSVDEVEEIARGRVWTGDQAWERGLVDEIGTLNDAIQIAMAMGGVQPGERASFEFYPKHRWINFNYLMDSMIESRMEESAVRLVRNINQASRLYDGKILYLMPADYEIK